MMTMLLKREVSSSFSELRRAKVSGPLIKGPDTFVSPSAQGRLTMIPSSMPVMLSVSVSVAMIQLVPAVFNTT